MFSPSAYAFLYLPYIQVCSWNAFRTKVNSKTSSAGWTVSQEAVKTLCQECLQGSQHSPERKSHPGTSHPRETLHRSNTKAGSWEDGSCEGSEVKSVKNHFLGTQWCCKQGGKPFSDRRKKKTLQGSKMLDLESAAATVLSAPRSLNRCGGFRSGWGMGSSSLNSKTKGNY